MTYEPYLSAVRAKPEAGKIIATTLDYPMVMDTFGCTPKFLAENPKAAKALADGYFERCEMIKAEPKKSFEIMGADVKQSGEAFENSQKYLRWQDRAANQKFFAGEHAAVQQGSGRPADGGGHHQVDSRHDEARRHALPAVAPTQRRRDVGGQHVVAGAEATRGGERLLARAGCTVAPLGPRGSSEIAPSRRARRLASALPNE